MDSARNRRALPWTYPPHSFRCHKLLVMVVLVWLLPYYQAEPHFGTFEMLPLYHRVYAKLKTEAKLLCAINAYLNTTIAWNSPNLLGINEYSITKTWKYNITRMLFNDWIINVLIIQNVQQEDFGVYECQAYNDYNLASANVTLVKIK